MNFLEAYFINPIAKRLSEHIGYAVLLYVLFFLGIYFFKYRSKRGIAFGAYTIFLFIILFLCRKYHGNPLVDIWGEWWISLTYKGTWNVDCLYNMVCFIPFAVLSPFRKKPLQAFLISLAYSLMLEVLQLVFFVGAFQVSDIAYNALGGFMGSRIYLIVERKKEQK